jgi:hypothetical protein
LKEFPVVKIVSGEGDVSIESWRPGRIVLKTKGKTTLLLVVRHLYYPNWKAKQEPQGQSLTVFPSGEQGFIGIEIPAGSQQVALTLERGSEESLGQKMSVLGSIALVGLLARACFRKTATDSKQSFTNRFHWIFLCASATENPERTFSLPIQYFSGKYLIKQAVYDGDGFRSPLDLLSDLDNSLFIATRWSKSCPSE